MDETSSEEDPGHEVLCTSIQGAEDEQLTTSFAGDDEHAKLSPTEILEYSLPQSWQPKSDLNSYLPSKFSRERLLQEAEAVEGCTMQNGLIAGCSKTIGRKIIETKS